MSIMDSNNKKTKLPMPHDDDLSNNKDHIGRIRVGKDFQVPVPPYSEPQESPATYSSEKALLVWSPTHTISDVKLSNYLIAAKDKFSYNEEQALGMLFWHKHNLKDAITDLANFTPCPDEWSTKDKILFEQGYQFHGKNFYGIKTMFSDKKIPQLVKYYYMWKKTRGKISVIDKYQKNREYTKSIKNGDYNQKKLDVDEDLSDSDSRTWKQGCQLKSPTITTRRNDLQGEGFCSNCNVYSSKCRATAKGKMCGSCFTHFKKTGTLRPNLASDANTLSALKLRAHPPKGMYINHDDLSVISVDSQASTILNNLSREVVSCKRIIQSNKQIISALNDKLSKFGSVAKYLSPPVSVEDGQWTNTELVLAVQGIHKYGKDFKAIAEVIGNKSELHIRHFYNKYKTCYNLDALLTENDPGNCLKSVEESK